MENLPKVETPKRLSDLLTEVLEELNEDGAISIKEFEETMRGRGFALFILLLAVPFMQPIPLPLLSTPFGVAIAILGFRIACGQRPWLPGFILKREISGKLLGRIVRIALKGARFFERFARPRMAFLQKWPGLRNLIGIGICAGGIVLCLPLPVPFSNTIPGWSVALLTLGLIERDGVMVLLGYFTGLLAIGYVALLFFLGKEGVEQLFQRIF